MPSPVLREGEPGKPLAILEAVGAFALALLSVVLVARSPLAQWGRTALLRPFVEYFALGLVAALAIALSRRPLKSFGITRDGLRGQVDAALVCLLPFAAGKALTVACGRTQLLASVTEPLIALAVATVWARLLAARSVPPTTTAVLVLLAWPQLAPGKAASALLFYPLVLAPAEELLFRGYIQSRVNLAFGRPWRVAGAPVGVGLLVSAGLFSLFHLVNLPAVVAGRLDPAWAMALPTLGWGLAFGYLRERTDSLLPPTLCHGVPQAIAWAFLGR